MKQNIYLIPGLGASSKIFERLHFDPKLYTCTYLEWLEPDTNETFENYIQRFIMQITEQNPILIGVSFGGIVAQEIAKRINYHKIIIISSIKTKNEYSPRLLFFKKYKAYRLFPSKSLNTLLKCASIFPKKSLIGKKVKMYNVYLTQRSAYYLDWCMRKALQWENEQPLERLVHIQGTRDHIFPIEYLQGNFIAIKNGTHAMILFKAKEISKILEEELKKQL